MTLVHFLESIVNFLCKPQIFVPLMAVHFWRVRKDGGISGPV